ncbi:hypothetical protein HGO53_04415 [Wolbachia endosymbiont of Diaphorina citri]|nr:hypothetical protein [Wolbachia endosymbiont of Diaphorina citri]QJT94507.1 hypothetical protein HGO48_03705 [Wolbachia endosymbiont of Diaphorina citri]QJT95748.1 hypothetical protein HGO49_03705 [Wolbachia endosymbiont of Diaphorina citri]QJT97110.1 hypothetical protein HGO53_04415 [Wolbachia endosymbiont of Diaphorina citri]QLK11404.1 hypothetical protein FK497_03755 [Wolbachia endosymbiont of Diaphorina citri]QXY87062.1 hypothetical protein GZ064_03870 [Wolbachia endosymbiont of Diaphor
MLKYNILMMMKKWIPVSATRMTEEEKAKLCLLPLTYYTYLISSIA